MTDILNIGRLLQTDENGFIVSESAESKIKSPWKEAVEEIKQAYIAHMGDSIHSIYVRGTVSRGEALEGISDIDTFVVLNRKIKDDERAWFKGVRIALEEKYSFATDIEFDVQEYSKIMDEEKGFAARFTIKTQSACIYGEDLSLDIPPFKANDQTASHLDRNLKKAFEKVKINLDKSQNPKDVQDWCRWIMKRIIRESFLLVMAREKAFTRDLYPSYEIFSKYYPDKEPEMKQALEYAINPSDSTAEVISFMDSFGIWVADEIEKKFS